MAKGAIQKRKKIARSASKEAAAGKEFKKFYRKSKSKPPFGPPSRKPKP
jgi:hypothetical protein